MEWLVVTQMGKNKEENSEVQEAESNRFIQMDKTEMPEKARTAKNDAAVLFEFDLFIVHKKFISIQKTDLF